MRRASTLTAERLRLLLDYDAASGEFRWKQRLSRRVAVGSVAGGVCKKEGYRRIGIDGVVYYASSLAWLHATGRWPHGEIDHKNGIRHDDRIENLRDVSTRVNSQNKRQAKSNSKTGLLGASLHKPSGKYVARIKSQGRYLGLGYFSTAEAAHAAYVEAKRRLHQGCTL